MWETAGDSEVESSRDSAPVPGAIVVWSDRAPRLINLRPRNEIRTIQPQLPFPQRLVHKSAMMRPRRIVVNIGSKVGTAGAHARH